MRSRRGGGGMPKARHAPADPLIGRPRPCREWSVAVRLEASEFGGGTLDLNEYTLGEDDAVDAGPPGTHGEHSCDEYPFKTTQEGLGWLPDPTWKTARRTFDGCSMPLPTQTGPVGVSSCMIAVRDQSSQGGTNNVRRPDEEGVPDERHRRPSARPGPVLDPGRR